MNDLQDFHNTCAFHSIPVWRKSIG